MTTLFYAGVEEKNKNTVTVWYRTLRHLVRYGTKQEKLEQRPFREHTYVRM